MCSEHRINLLPLPSSTNRGHYGNKSHNDKSGKSARVKIMYYYKVAGKLFQIICTKRANCVGRL